MTLMELSDIEPSVPEARRSGSLSHISPLVPATTCSDPAFCVRCPSLPLLCPSQSRHAAVPSSRPLQGWASLEVLKTCSRSGPVPGYINPDTIQ
ncbi:hypothetical protein SKAU_G00257300 [Synaphobranchus kaupii]|uniref:Uncharacterized protein n=1 Tax=Synaphobranchus kaupii TaxID=118154 RepID=A0A9Q1ISG4_SYNKA|nr:hypothetical protein SKAU_G00257300 [Synaphobranchus kaupii]